MVRIVIYSFDGLLLTLSSTDEINIAVHQFGACIYVLKEGNHSRKVSSKKVLDMFNQLF